MIDYIVRTERSYIFQLGLDTQLASGNSPSASSSPGKKWGEEYDEDYDEDYYYNGVGGGTLLFIRIPHF